MIVRSYLKKNLILNNCVAPHLKMLIYKHKLCFFDGSRLVLEHNIYFEMASIIYFL